MSRRSRKQRWTLKDKLVELLVLALMVGVVYVHYPELFRRNSASPETTAGTVDVTDYNNTAITFNVNETDGETQSVSIPQYDGSSDVYVVNDNTPYFTNDDLTVTSTYITLSELDDYGRAGQANAVVGQDTLRQGDRADISSIHPSGWWEAKASTVNVNRSHLIGSEIADGISERESGTNAVGTPNTTNDPRNLVTASRMCNAGNDSVPGSMLEYETQVINSQEDGDLIRYRVTPIFDGVDVTCHGILMEAESIGDNGAALKFCVYVYNVQPGYTTNYTTGVWSEIH